MYGKKKQIIGSKMQLSVKPSCTVRTKSFKGMTFKERRPIVNLISGPSLQCIHRLIASYYGLLILYQKWTCLYKLTCIMPCKILLSYPFR